MKLASLREARATVPWWWSRPTWRGRCAPRHPAGRPRRLGRRRAAAAGAFALDPAALGSPLPRAFLWLDGSTYVNHVELVRRAPGVELPASFWTDPLMTRAAPTASWRRPRRSAP